MAKAFKGQFAKSQTVNTQGEFIATDSEFSAVRAMFRPLDSSSLNSPAALSAATAVETVSDFDDGFLVVKPQSGEFTVLDCLSDKDLMLRYLENHGASPVDSPVTVVPNPLADEVGLAMAVGGTLSGNIDFTGDTDDITIFLVAGQKYLFSERGTGANALNDTFLQLRNPSNTLVAQDDDGGNGLNSIFTFTATVTGNYVIRAAAFDNGPSDPGTGGWTVDVRVQGVDAIGDTNATSVPLSLGTTFGFRETGTGGVVVVDPNANISGDLDRYSVNLVAGHFYSWKVAGGIDSDGVAGSTEIDTYIRLLDAAGNLIAKNDDNGSTDFSSSLGFFAQTTGTYYFDVTGWTNTFGGYVIDFQDIDYASLDPLDSIDWRSADEVQFTDVNGVPTAYVYFAVADESFGELNDAGTGPRESFGWNDFEKAQLMLALEEYEHILGVNYEVTTDVNQATFRVMTTTSTEFGAYFYPQDPGYGTQQGIGAFNVDSGGWGDFQQSLERGGFSFAVILHEFGHAHGLAHPHDNGGGSDIMVGVTAAQGSYGIFNLNQGVYTVMSYNDAWVFHPDGPSPFTIAGIDNGWSGGLGAFDIAELQIRYGVHAYNGTDTVYSLTDVVDDAFYQSIWDSGGNDTIAYAGTLNATIDLTAATLDYSPTGAGIVSYVIDPAPGTSPLRGGYTIANNVVIENATGGGGDDVLVGNSAANVLTGNNGADNFIGRGGDDTMHGGAGTDTAYYDGVRADYKITAIITGGVVTGFTVKDNNTAAPANSANPIVVANEGTDTLDGVETLHFSNVNLNLAGTVVVLDGDGAVVSVHSTIQAAIDAATTVAGYTIFAGAGTYAEDVNVTKDVTIQGANVGVVGDGTRGAETSVKSFTISTDGVTIDGVEVTGSANSAGVYVNAGSDDFSLVNSVLNGMTDAYGVLTGQIDGLDVTDNLFVGYGIGMYVSGGESTGDIHSNIFQGGGLEAVPATTDEGLYNGIILETSHVAVSDNTFDDMYYSSIVITPFGPDTVDLATFITGNDYPGSLAERVIFVYPTNSTHNVLGTDANEGFDAETAQLASPNGYGYTSASTSFDGRGGNDYAWGGEMADTFIGGSGSDQLFGKGGNDSLTGGTDNDLIDGGTGIDTAHIGGTLSYVDTVVGWAITSSADGTDFVQNTEIVVDGGGQRNLLVRGSGYATLQAALTGAATGDIVRLATGTYTGTVNYSVNGLTVIAQPGAVQNVTYATASAFGITVVAADGNDTITTGGGNDFIYGGGGTDTLAGGNGNDLLYGGLGADNLTGGAGDDIYFVDQAGDVVTESVGGGRDIVYSASGYTLAAGVEVEVLAMENNTLTTAANNTGNEFAGQLIYGNAGANVLNGGGGGDYLIGLGGNDTYYISDVNDVVFEGASGGSDTVYSSTGYTLGADAEVEVLALFNNTLTTAVNNTGNQFAQLIYGNAGANVLDGKGGNDVLVGLGGADTFAFTTAPGAGNVDIIVDFEHGTDKIALDDAVFTGIGGLGPLGANAFVVGSSAADADDRIIYNSASGELFFDADGNGGGAAVMFAIVTPGTTLTASDFQVI